MKSLGDMKMKKNKIGCYKVCCGKEYRRANTLGCMVAFLQQATGINIFIFYSNTLFTKLQNDVPLFTPNFTSGMMGLVDFLFSILGCYLLGFLGRKTIMIWGSVIMTLSLIGLGVFNLKEDPDQNIWTYLQFAMIMIFNMAF